MGELNVDEMRLFFEDRAAARAKCEQDRLEFLELSPEQLHDRLKTVLSAVDAAVLTGEFAQYLVDCVRSGLAPGAEGWWDDDVAVTEPWGFELRSIRTPVLLYHGRHDRFVPFAHGEWLAGQIPGVQAELSDDDGHLTLPARHLERVHAWLLERLR
jgi:pimeloyl-ACP methyl ester carboxylesterase